jgi:hypothetical protein
MVQRIAVGVEHSANQMRGCLPITNAEHHLDSDQQLEATLSEQFTKLLDNQLHRLNDTPNIKAQEVIACTFCTTQPPSLFRQAVLAPPHKPKRKQGQR